MPLTLKGKKILRAMRRYYGKKRGTEVFYASARKGIIVGVSRASVDERKRKLERKARK